MKRLVVAPIQYFYSDYRNPLPDTINLEGGYKMKKFNPNILDPVFEFFTETFSEHDKTDLRNCRYAVYYNYTSGGDSSETPPEIATDINRIMLTLRVVKRTRAIPTILHFRGRGRRKEALQVVHKPLINITFPPGSQPGSQHFNKNDSYKIRKYWKKVRKLYEDYGGSYHKILNTLYFFEIGHHNHLYKPRIVLFVTALESLFNTSSHQIGYTLKIRCSHFLEKNPTRRINLADNLKELYKLRSLFVHGQGTPRRLLRDTDRQEILLSDSEEITRKSLQKIFDKDLVELFGKVNDLNIEFHKLEMGLPNKLV